VGGQIRAGKRERTLAVTFRPSTEADLATVLSWYNQTKTFGLATAIEYPVDIATVQLQYHFACLDPNRQPLGICLPGNDALRGVVDLILSEPDETTATIGLFLVAAEQQGAGLGKATVKQLEADVTRAGLSRLRVGVLSGNKPGLTFWTSLGYEQMNGSDRLYVIAGQEHRLVWMERLLS
jgi:L-amino acid N-acyltransferase YncA